jgi:serine/threonine kinase 16
MILNTFFQICEGVLYLHNLQPEPIAHRDLKPHNILLDDDLTPIIMDLGRVFFAYSMFGTWAKLR